MTGYLAMYVASFAGSFTGIGLGGVLTWRYYIKPRMANAGRRARIQAMRQQPAPPSQATATTRGFVRHEGDVTVASAGWSRAKKATRL